MTREEIQSKIDDCELELRSLMDEVKNNADVKVEDIRAKKEEIEKRRADLTKELAQLNAPAPEGEETRGLLFNRDAWLKAAEEKRALQIGATKFGSVNQIKSLVKEIAEKDGVLAKASFYYGANASTVIPVLSPSIAMHCPLSSALQGFSIEVSNSNVIPDTCGNPPLSFGVTWQPHSIASSIC